MHHQRMKRDNEPRVARLGWILGLTLTLAGLLMPVSGIWVQAAELRVVATSPSMAALVRSVAGADVDLEVLAGPNRDLHRLSVKPSMIRDLRSADLVVATGAELEIGWLPPAIAQAANPDLLPGRPGYFEAAAQVPLLEVGGEADRALGDVHPAGNPHVNMDPVRMAQVAHALADRMASLNPGKAADYQAGADAFARAVETRMPAWQSRLQNAPGALLYHADATYLLDRFGVPLLGTIEPIPGVPPSGAQLKQLTDTLAQQEGVIIHAPYQPSRPSQRLGKTLGWPVTVLSLEPPLDADGEGYLSHIDDWVEQLAIPQ